MSDVEEAPIRPLRQGITVDRGGGFLVDADLGARVRLDPRGLELAAALDAPQTVESLAERLSAEPEAIARMVAAFEANNLLDTEAARTLAADARASEAAARTPPATVRLSIRADAAFTCTMCGSCCGGHQVGPVQDDVLRGLEPHTDALVAATRATRGLFVTMPAPRGAPVDTQVMCHLRDGSCVFLSDDRRCIIHRDLGADAKPRPCRLFPYRFIATPDGVAVSISPECRGFAEARGGKALADQQPELRRLLALAGALARTPKVVRLAPRTAVPWRTYRDLEDSLHAALHAHAHDPTAALLAMQRLIDRALAQPQTVDVPPEALASGLDTLTRQLAQHAGQFADAMGDDSDEQVIHVEGLRQFQRAASNLRQDLRRLLLPTERPDRDGTWSAALHQQLHGKILLEAPTVIDGFARLSFMWFVARGIAIDSARRVKRRHLVVQDVVDGLVVSTALLDNDGFEPLLSLARAPLTQLFFAALPSLVTHGPELPQPRTRVELFRF